VIRFKTREKSAMRLALYQPDIPQNTGTLLRLGACFGVPVDIIEPCGFPFSIKGLRRSGMDYIGETDMVRHADWGEFRSTVSGRIVLLTTTGSTPHTHFTFEPNDCLLLGRESAGVPPEIHDAADARIRVPMRSGLRSLNVAMAAAVCLGEALRQTGQMDDLAAQDPTLTAKY
jgi:tRNA (cytidine/uridine-2'-O-)-methyltransferase